MGSGGEEANENEEECEMKTYQKAEAKGGVDGQTTVFREAIREYLGRVNFASMRGGLCPIRRHTTRLFAFRALLQAETAGFKCF